MNDAILSTPTLTRPSGAAAASAWGIWLPIAVGVLFLYVPTYLHLARIFWATDEGAQGPIFLVIFAGLVWRRRSAVSENASSAASRAAGWLLVALAAPLYVVGRSQEFFQLELGSEIPLFCGIVLILAGAKSLRLLWFSLFFLLFTIPVPGSLLDAVLLPLKELVSSIVATGLFALGLPIARDGVVLFIGPYQLLIADACSGLNSMIALTAVGFVYVHLCKDHHWGHKITLLLAAVPIAFLANVLRVAALVLITFYGGDSSGRSFHAIAAYVEIVSAFAAFFLLDGAVDLIEVRFSRPGVRRIP
jgi:exosortase B